MGIKAGKDASWTLFDEVFLREMRDEGWDGQSYALGTGGSDEGDFSHAADDGDRQWFVSKDVKSCSVALIYDTQNHQAFMWHVYDAAPVSKCDLHISTQNRFNGHIEKYYKEKTIPLNWKNFKVCFITPDIGESKKMGFFKKKNHFSVGLQSTIDYLKKNGVVSELLAAPPVQAMHVAWSPTDGKLLVQGRTNNDDKIRFTAVQPAKQEGLTVSVPSGAQVTLEDPSIIKYSKETGVALNFFQENGAIRPDRPG